MSTSTRSGLRDLQRFGVVILSGVPFENELTFHYFIVSFLFVFQQLLQLIFINPIKYIVWFLSECSFLDHSYATKLLDEVPVLK